MRVKVGNRWFSCTPEAPIMLVTTAEERKQIGEMPAHFTSYAQFHDDDRRTVAEREAWMKEEEGA